MYNNAPEAGLASLLASRGRGGDSALVHMAPEELAGLQKLAMAHGGSLTINPETGLYEANFLKKVLPMIIGAVLPGVPVLGKLASTIGTAVGSQALGSALLVGGATALIEGDLKKGLQAGLGAYSGANLRGALEASAAAPVSTASPEEVVQAGQAAERGAEAIGASPEAVNLAKIAPESINLARPTIGFSTPSSVAASAALPMSQLAAQTVSQAPAPTGIAGLFQGAQNLFTNPRSREAFGQALGGGFKSPLAQNLSRYATITGAVDSFTPEIEMPSGAYDDDSVYMPGEFNPMYGMGAQYGKFLPGQFYKKTKKGLVPYNPYAKAPGFAMGGVIPNPNPNYPMSREVISNYQPDINPFTGEERFANGGVTQTGQISMDYEGFDPSMFTPEQIAQLTKENRKANEDFAAANARPSPRDATPTMINNPAPPNPLDRIMQPGQSFTDIPRPIQIAAPSPFAAPTRSTSTVDELYNQFRQYNPDLPEDMLRTAAQNRAAYLQSQYEQEMGAYNSPESVAARTAANKPVNTVASGAYAGAAGIAPGVTRGDPSVVMASSSGRESTSPPPGSQNEPINPYSPQNVADARKRFEEMAYGPPPPPVNTKPVMDYVTELNQRAANPAFYRYPNPYANTGGDGGGGGGGGRNTDGNEPGGGRGGAGTGPGGVGGGTGGGTGVVGGGTGTGGTKTPTTPKTPTDDSAEEESAFDKFKKWARKKYEETDAFDLIGLGIGAQYGLLASALWNQLTPSLKKAFGIQTTELTPEETAALDAKAKEEADKIKTEREINMPRGGGGREGREGREGSVGGGYTPPMFFPGSGGIGGGSGRRGVITIDENIKQSKKGGRIRAMQAGGLPTPPNPYGAAVGEDYNFGFAGGGVMPTEYAAAGKLLEGAGDGMSDDIPAVIRGKGVQRAALADGEFVVPADVVSHLGNGSTKAGAKKLYAMMDRIRKARTGETRQAPAVKANKYLPA